MGTRPFCKMFQILRVIRGGTMLLAKIDEDLKMAMKAKDTLKTDTLRMLKSALNYYKIEKQVKEIN